MTNSYYDPVRKKHFQLLPEEKVRQDFILYLTEVKHFVPGLLSVEIALKELPHLQSQAASLPLRRVDLVAYAKDIHPQHSLYPLLLVECKDKDFDTKAWDQLKGYNAYIKAPFIALVNYQSFAWQHYNPLEKSYEIGGHFPSYQELIAFMQKRFF